MSKTSEKAKKLMMGLVQKEASLSANSTTCVALYQPKAPAALKKLSKVEK